MKKMISAMMILAAGIAFADYGYLNFVIDQAGTGNPIAFEYARVGVEGQDAYLDMQGTTSPWVLQDGSGYATDPNMANLGAYDSPFYSYYVELYDMAFNAVGRSDAYAYGDLKSHISTEMGQGGITSSWTVSVFHSVPEPTSGVLFLLGLASLALRRKRLNEETRGKTPYRRGLRDRRWQADRLLPRLSPRRRRYGLRVCNSLLGVKNEECGRRCARAIISSFFILTSSLLFSAANDTLITFSTTGVDRYADGSAVKDGECYALVWTRDGAQFAGLAADGRPVNGADSVLVLAAPIARDGKCPPTVFELNARFAAQHADGSLDAYLLDTRNAAGQVTGVGANGRPERVNGYGWVAKATGGGRGATRPADVAGEAGGSVVGGPSAVSTVSAVPKDVPKPKIKAMRIVGGYAYLTVEGTSPCLQYRAVPVGLDGKSDVPVAGAPVDGKAGEDVVIVTPAKGSSGFFRVERN